MSDLLKEYVSWNTENSDFYLKLKEHTSLLYERFMPVYEVLQFVNEAVQKKELDFTDDLEKIFSVGLEYLHDQIETCKIYLETVFKNDFHHFLEYDVVINSLLYIEDIRYEIAEKKIAIKKEKLDKLLKESYAIIQEKKEIPLTYKLFVDDSLKTIIGDNYFEFYGVIDIFIDVAETLGLYLFEDSEDFVLGNDI
ncbi:MAG: hypothetical protein KJ971_01545 [Firmicutes bacterium]|nr:hypothetical protein [Bacillota bacterium]